MENGGGETMKLSKRIEDQSCRKGASKMRVIKIKSEEGYVFTIKRAKDEDGIFYEVYNASGELEGDANTLADAKQIARQGGERVGY